MNYLRKNLWSLSLEICIIQNWLPGIMPWLVNQLCLFRILMPMFITVNKLWLHPLTVCRSNRYTVSMLISMRSLWSPLSEQVLVSCGLQGLHHSLTFVVRLLQYPRLGRWWTMTPRRRTPWFRGPESFFSLQMVEGKWAELVTVKSEFPVS